MKKAILVATVIIVSVVLMSASCKRAHEADSLSALALENGTNGVVTMIHAEEGCELLISVMEYGVEIFYIPVALDDKFKVEGTKINFTHYDSRMNQGRCTLGHPIVIDSIQMR